MSTYNPLVDHQGDISRKMKAIKEYRERTLPETVTNYWRAKLGIDGKRAGVNIVVPDCDWTQEEINRSMVRRGGRELAGRMLYLPEELIWKEGLIRLGKMYPGLRGEKAEGSYTLEDKTQVTNIYDTYGWIKVEATSIAPNRNTTEEELRRFAEEQGYNMQREAVYILASLANKDLTGEFFDEGGKIWSRLGGSRGEGGVIAACFYSDGHLRVLLALDPMQRDEHYGGRFEQTRRR
jgi:hypothetical protein